jgi:hypothetical protein
MMNENIAKNKADSTEGIQPFPLLRYFSAASLLAFLLVAALLVFFNRQAALNELVKIGEDKNTAITQSFANVIWPVYKDFLNSASDLDPDAIRSHSETARLRQAVIEQTRGLSVIKVKIYDLEGKTVFSTQESQIGEDKSENAGYLSALNGTPASELTHRDTFSAFEGEIEDRDVISSYVPIMGSSGVEGVFEVYDDVTPLLEDISTAQRNIAIGVSLTLAILYAFLFLIVQRADNLIRMQFVRQIESTEELKKAHASEEQVNQFFQFTLLNIIEYVSRGTEKETLLSYLEQMKQQFNDLKYWKRPDQ